MYQTSQQRSKDEPRHIEPGRTSHTSRHVVGANSTHAPELANRANNSSTSVTSSNYQLIPLHNMEARAEHCSQ